MDSDVLLSDISDINQLLIAVDESLEYDITTKFPKHNIKQIVKLYQNHKQVENFFKTLQSSDISIDTFLIMSQMMYFTDDRIFLVALPQVEASVQMGVSKPSHSVLLSTDIVRSGVKVSKTLSFSSSFKNYDDVLIEKRAIIFSCNSKSQFLQNLVNTGKEYAYFFYRAWEGIFPNLLNGILYDDFINFINEFSDTSYFETFLFNWGFHIDNPFYKENPDLAVGYSTSIKQWFDTDTKFADEERVSLLTNVQEWFLNQLQVKPIIVNSKFTDKALANKRNNGFFATPISNERFILALITNGIIPDVVFDTDEVPQAHFKYNNVVVGDLDTPHYGINRIFNTQSNKSITGLGENYELSVKTLSPNLKTYFGDTIWENSAFIANLDTYLKTDIDLLLVLIALKTKRKLIEVFDYASTGDKTKLKTKNNVPVSISLMSELKKLYAQTNVPKKGRPKKTVTLEQAHEILIDNVVCAMFYDISQSDYKLIKSTNEVINDPVTNKITIEDQELHNIMNHSSLYKESEASVQDDYRKQVIDYFESKVNKTQTNENRDFDKEKEFVLNLLKLVVNK
jgi:hypothetical protein